MKTWISIEVLNKWSNSTEYQTWLDISKGSEGDKSLAISISREDKSFDASLEVNDNTIRVLEFLVPYYDLIIIGNNKIKGISKHNNNTIPASPHFGTSKNTILMWPAIWYIKQVLKNLSNGGYVGHTQNIYPKVISIGVYTNYRDKFYKEVDISQLKYLRKKNL